MGSDGRAAYPADRRRPSPERERQLAALRTLSEGTGHPVPAEFFPVLHVSAACCDQRLCAALCPTAALTVADSQGAARLQLSGERCIACGACARACPQGAITLQPFGGAAGTRTLLTHARARCASCGDAYTPDAPRAGDDAAPALCPACAKSQRFMNDARRQLFGNLN